MKKLLTIALTGMITFNTMAQQKIIQTAGRDALGDFAPEFARLNDDILFGEVWSRLRDHNSHSLLCRLAESVGRVSTRQGCLGG